MKNPKKSEKLFFEKIVKSAKTLLTSQQGLEIGQLIVLIRAQLGMSQRSLANRAKVPQSTISKIESGLLQPNISTLKKVLSSMECKLLMSAVPEKSLETIRKNQAIKKAEKKIQYLKGTMSLEKQIPDREFLKELIDDEIRRLLNSSSSELWE